MYILHALAIAYILNIYVHVPLHLLYHNCMDGYWAVLATPLLLALTPLTIHIMLLSNFGKSFAIAWSGYYAIA